MTETPDLFKQTEQQLWANIKKQVDEEYANATQADLIADDDPTIICPKCGEMLMGNSPVIYTLCVPCQKKEKQANIYYETVYYKEVKKRKGKNKGKVITERHTYRTKSYTDHHKYIVSLDERNYTLQCDTSIPWASGVYSKVIAGKGFNNQKEK